MPWSHTAPRFHEAEEQKEKEDLTAEELEDIHNDIYGTQEELVVTELNIRTGLRMMSDAIDMLDTRQKEAYLEAKKRIPELVENESDPVRFLKCERFDAPAAARRLTEYWRQRRLIFAPHRYLQPMTLEGAMSEDWENLQKAYMVMLPNDEQGRNVIFFDRTKFASTQRDVMLRILFYMYHVSCESETAPHRGFVFIENLKNFNFTKHFDRIMLKKATGLLDAIPGRRVASHMLCGKSFSMLHVWMPVVKHIIGRQNRLRTRYYFGSDSEMLAEIQLCGFCPAHLSHVIGGGFSHDDYLLWLSRRREEEKKSSP